MELSEMITIIREDYLDDTFSGWQSASDAEKEDQFLWSDSALLRYITEAQRQACNRTDFLFDDTTFSITLVVGTHTYAINNKITFIENIDFDANKKVTHRSVEEVKRNNTDWRTASGMTGNDLVYTVRGRKMRVYPIPDAVDAGKVLTLDTFRLPLEPLTSVGDDLEIPDEYHRDLVWWVLYEAYSKQDADGYDKDKGLGYLAQFNQAFGEYVPSEVRLNQLQEDSSLRTRAIDYIGSSSSSSSDESEWYN